MKTIIEINNNNYGSTGNIMMNIANLARDNGYIVYTCAKNSRVGRRFNYDNQILVGLWLERVISSKLAYLTGVHDRFNILGTKLFINKLNKLKPNLIHLHNIHGSFINIEMLFNYIKKNNIPVIWTLHDCWPVTGQCTHFIGVKCNNWTSGCHNCPKLDQYPSSKIDNTNKQWIYKNKLFSNINNLTFASPSNWLKDILSKSFLSNYNCLIINNGINLNKFKPTDGDFRKEHNIKDDDYLLLSVANFWNNKKGLDTLIKLANDLPNKYKIVIVGTNDENDKILPNNIISIHKTFNQDELLQIYSCANLFINPTREDNFPTVNIESLACGTPVLTYDTGGSKEMLNDKCGNFIKTDDYETFKNEVIRICETKPYSSQDCINRSKDYDMNNKFKEYIDLFKTTLD